MLGISNNASAYAGSHELTCAMATGKQARSRATMVITRTKATLETFLFFNILIFFSSPFPFFFLTFLCLSLGSPSAADTTEFKR